jgi:hypothetical protein
MLLSALVLFARKSPSRPINFKYYTKKAIIAEIDNGERMRRATDIKTESDRSLGERGMKC